MNRSTIGASIDTALPRRVVAVVIADRRAVRRMKRGFMALFVGRRHGRRRVEVLGRLGQRRQRLQLGTRPIPIRSFDRVEPMVRRPVQFGCCGSTHGFAAGRRRTAGLDCANVEEAGGWDSRVVCESLGIGSSAIDEFLRLGRVLDSVAVEEEGKGREHAESDNSDGGGNGDSFGSLGRLRCLWDRNGGV